ncbi:MAG: hypothetical protein GY930_14760 [bacterium]|nr:hypothetical protein [bacterium]
MKISNMRWLSTLVVGSLVSCASAQWHTERVQRDPYPERVEQALDAAGENRGELEHGHSHYGRTDAEKQAAMEFLIENMPGPRFCRPAVL